MRREHPQRLFSEEDAQTQNAAEAPGAFQSDAKFITGARDFPVPVSNPEWTIPQVISLSPGLFEPLGRRCQCNGP